MVERQWDLHRFAALQTHWAAHGPPIHMSAAAYLGLDRGRSSAISPDEFEQFLSGIAPNGFG